MEVTFGDLAKDRIVNKERLDEENVLQPQRLGHYADQYAQAKTELDRAKANYDATCASRFLYYRRNPPTDIKCTDPVYEALVKGDREVQDARGVLDRAQEAVNVCYAALSSVQDMRNSIDNLIKLRLSRFYGEQEYDASRDRLNKE